MTKWFKQFLLGSLIGLLGVFLHLSPLGLALEEKFGLEWLFHLRGAVPAPDDVIVIAIDQPSANHLGTEVKVDASTNNPGFSRAANQAATAPPNDSPNSIIRSGDMF